MKKIVSMVLVIIMLLSMSCLTAFADSGNTPTIGPWLSESIGKSGRAAILVFDSAEDKDIILAENTGGDVGMAVYNDALEGVTYDLKTNTLTLKDANMSDCEIVANFMGDDFKLKIEGDCSIASMIIQSADYSSSLNIVGSGTLSVNSGKTYAYNPISVFSYGTTSTAKLSIADSVTLHVYASDHEEGYEGAATPDSVRLMSVYGTGYDTADKAFTAGGKAIEGFKVTDRKKQYMTGLM